MSRLTTNKPVDEMSMLELAYNSCYVKDGKAMYEDYETVRDARDFARNLYKAYLDEELPTDDEEFDGRMMDDLQFESEVHLRGLIALFYRNLWVMADLREKLKAYEDKEEQGMLIELPVAIGSTVYVISMCGNVKTVLDGDFETATGYYCPFELKSQCPHDCDDCEDVKNKWAVFEDTIKYIGYDETGIHLFTEDTGMCCTIGKDTFFTRSEAEEALAKMGGK